jgi:Fe-S-cluster containining protein
MMTLTAIKINHCTIACHDCGGKCCKQAPGLFHPDQFKNDEEIKALLRTGDYEIDSWYIEDGIDIWFLRPAKDSELIWSGTCRFLTDDGCDLPRDKRPIECLALKPMTDGECKSSIDGHPKEELVYEWDNSKFDLYILNEEVNND